MDITTYTLKFLSILANIAGGYGIAIIIITVAIRLALWGQGEKQQRSMRKMQELSPKLKYIQERYKNDPQKMQMKMQEFYKDNDFNPFSGCLPLIIQLPIFILLYQALISPQFIQIAGDSSFLFINRLDNVWKSYSGKNNDGTFSVAAHDTFGIPAKITVTMKDGKKVDVKINNPLRGAVKVEGEIEPSKPMELKLSLDSIRQLDFEEKDNIASAKISVINNATKEMEDVDFIRKGGSLFATIPTNKAETAYHFDVLALIILFAISMIFATKVTTSISKKSKVQMDAQQQAMQNTMGTVMPIVLTGTFLFFPIPAGVLLYLVVSNIIQICQTIYINKKIDEEDEKKNTGFDKKYDLDNAKQVEVKDIKNKDDDNK